MIDSDVAGDPFDEKNVSQMPKFQFIAKRYHSLAILDRKNPQAI